MFDNKTYLSGRKINGKRLSIIRLLLYFSFAYYLKIIVFLRIIICISTFFCLCLGVQSAYWVMLEEGRISQITANILIRSVDEAMDRVSTEPLCDWKGLQSSVQFPSHYRFLQMTRLPRKLVTFFTVERLESGCCICAAFLRAHRIARRQLHEFIGKCFLIILLFHLQAHTPITNRMKFFYIFIS
jgi:hypothetical protein